VLNTTTLQGIFPCWFTCQYQYLVSPDTSKLVTQEQEKTPMKRLGFALILTCVLSVSALAGEIPTAGAPAVPPTPPPATQSTTTTTILLTILSLIR
jgi:hypothetical protein